VARNHDPVIDSGHAVGQGDLVGGVVPWWLRTRADSLVALIQSFAC
jgi:hypothetical protein